MLVTCIVMLFAGAGAGLETQKVFALDFTLYQNGTVSDVSATTVDGETVSVPGQGPGAYRFSVFAKDGSLIYFKDADISFYYPHSGEQESTRVVVRLPYIGDATEVRLSHKGDHLYTFYLPEQLCSQDSDGVCTTYCSGKHADPDCDDLSTGIADDLPVPLLLGALTVIVLGIGGYIVWRRYGGDRNQSSNRRRNRRNRQIQNNRNRRRRHER